ncbi:DUF4476 domain-containing protein [Melittangium boletus]|uniref:DUF4476 domain-containing protein n=1 Tax=Melittangium boletus DSM 14713 TaxID=1294270 RepID=A0A250IG98_9BACT|nr:DUF4476 domain-containing protein [Melittangium boletus]ATB30240.1 hypothetical protein MEBOL_003700 [Melittangium boletus DSM 14713]
MKPLLAALALLAALSASAQTSPALTPPPGEASGAVSPGATGFRGGPGPEADARWGSRGTPVVVEREDLERRLARLESLMGEAVERSRRGDGRGKLNEAYQELRDLRKVLSSAPDARGYNPPRPPAPAPPPPPAYSPIADSQLRRILDAVARESFAANKTRVLEESARGNYFLVGQVQQLLPQFSFSSDRLNAVRLLWPRVLDRQNGYQLNSSFSFSKDKEELQRIISG